MKSRNAILLAVLTASLAVALAAQAFLADRPRPRTLDPGQKASSIISVGDILLGDAASETLQKKGYGYPFERVAELLDAKLVMGNLEGPITEAMQPFQPDKAYVYKQKPEAAKALRNAGFDVLALGNNHALDYGPHGLRDTQSLLGAAGISSFGAGASGDEARRGLVIEVQQTRVGLLSYLEPYDSLEKAGWYASRNRAGVARLDIEALREDIARIRRTADIVIVHAHFGQNYRPTTDYQRNISRQIIDAGADAVNGHHSHTAQGVDVYKGKPILYSLGNFTFGTPGRFRDMPGYGWIARYQLSKGRIASVDLDLIETDNRHVGFRPRLVGTKQAKRAWADLSIGFNAEPTWHGSTATITLPP